jgi:hypothetical protein
LTGTVGRKWENRIVEQLPSREIEKGVKDSRVEQKQQAPSTRRYQQEVEVEGR